jgi:hypothetical protein
VKPKVANAWVPAFAGMTAKGNGNSWVPAFAGKTAKKHAAKRTRRQLDAGLRRDDSDSWMRYRRSDSRFGRT